MNYVLFCMYLVGVSSALMHAMEMNEKKEKEYNKKFQKKQGTKDQNSEKVISIIRAQSLRWDRKAITCIEQGINPWYRDPKTKQSLLEIALEFNKYSVDNPIVEKLVEKGVPFTALCTYSDFNTANMNLLYACYNKSQREHTSPIKYKGSLKKYRKLLYRYVHKRIKLIDERAVTSLGMFKEESKKMNARIPKPLQKIIMAESGHKLIFQDFCDALKQITDTPFFRTHNRQYKEDFIDGFWNYNKWITDMKAFYADPKKATTENNLFKKFLFWEDRKRSRTI